MSQALMLPHAPAAADGTARVMDDRARARLAEYRAFLEQKTTLAPSTGIEISPSDVNPLLKPHQVDAVCWAAAGGCRGLFAKFGLGKTFMQLEIERLILAKTGGRGLIVMPLGVRQEFVRDAAKLGIPVTFIRSHEEATADGIYLTNYESVRDGKIDPNGFTVVCLDEGSVMRSFGSKTFSALLYGDMMNVPYRIVATATPDPNDYVELLAYAQFLGIMDIGQAKTRWFKRDSEHADHLTLYPHKAHEFWMWVSSWALFLQRPSDLGYSDEGYALPPLDVHWHEVPSNHATAVDDMGAQMRMFKESTYGVSEASREKRESLAARVAKLMELRAEDPAAHRVIWHDLEAERHAIEAAIPGVVSVYGDQDLDDREAAIIQFADGETPELAAKPSIAGSGTNLQRHCAWAIYLGIGFKFSDFVQSVHRIYRFLQAAPRVRIDLIYTEAERPIRRVLEAKWRRHDAQVEEMSAILREHGMTSASMVQTLRRTIGVERAELAGEGYRLVNNDCVIETIGMEPDSVDLIVTSLPFSSQYEYTPTFEDFGHTNDNAEFWTQMDFLTPELLRVLRPGRVCALHIKDRVVPGAMTGLRYPTTQPFHCEATMHFLKHGFTYDGMITVVTDVVAENAQTYRLSYTQQVKDGSRMGAGMPEYILLFRKAPTDHSNGYADVPVTNVKPNVRLEDGSIGPWEDKRPIIPGTGYSRGRWQYDANGFWRSSGNRFLTPVELANLPRDVLMRRFKEYSKITLYDHEHYVDVAEALEANGQLSPEYSVLPPQSWHPDVWTDVFRARGMNTLQAAAGREKHLCPLPFDIVDRLIVRFSMAGETVFDPFGGLMTTPKCALELKRCGVAVELNARYWRDGGRYVEDTARRMAVPTLFDLLAPPPAEAAS